MALQKVIQMRKGTISLSVFKADLDGKVLLSLDKDFVSRRIKGPLFTESELAEVAELIADYQESESRSPEIHPRLEMVAHAHDTYQRALAEAEVKLAIEQARLEKTPEPPVKGWGKITAVPPLPQYRYVHTCPKCNSHVASHLRLPGGSTLKLCPFCKTVYGGSSF